ncbi:MAG: winged helix-turn-helix transcriptional regulator [Thermodesulfobacteriota bacterium]
MNGVEGFRVTVFKATQKDTQKMTFDEKIIAVMKNNPKVTRHDIASLLGTSPNTIKVHIAKLKKEGRLKRIGPDKGGYWEVE